VKGRGRRQKGARGENELAQLLTDQLGFVVKRKLGQARDGGDDIQVGKYKIEVKRHERLSVMDWVRQVEATCGVGEVPIVVFRQNNLKNMTQVVESITGKRWCSNCQHSQVAKGGVWKVTNNNQRQRWICQLCVTKKQGIV